MDFTEPLQALAREALGLALGSFHYGDHVPFVMLAQLDGQNVLFNMEGDGGIELVEEARGLVIASSDTTLRYGIVWDGFLTVDGVRYAAAFVEVGERGHANGYIVAQNYTRDDEELRAAGQPVIVAHVALLLRT